MAWQMTNNSKKINVLVVFGTRPEAIKMAPVIVELEKSERVNVNICSTGQHREMLTQILSFFDISLDYDLDIMTPNQALDNVFIKIVDKLSNIFKRNKFDMVLVHGDTVTTIAASIAAFYNNIKVGHVEAGLRSDNIMAPWPEEANRRMTSAITSINFAPTVFARDRLLREGHAEGTIFVTGNTVIDALVYSTKKLSSESIFADEIKKQFSYLNSEKLILVTGHRRESFGSGFDNICQALLHIASILQDWTIIYPVHLNPNVEATVYPLLSNVPNIILTKPLEYPSFVYLMQRADLILTDSGGIQEEAPFLGKPVLVMRETTERVEALEGGFVKLVGTTSQSIIDGALTEISNIERGYSDKRNVHSPYGDGNAASLIVSQVIKFFEE